MKNTLTSICIVLFLSGSATAQESGEKEAVTKVAQQFFDALEKRDSLAFHTLFIRGAMFYHVSEEKDSVSVGGYSPFNYRFRPDRVVKEKMKGSGVAVQIHERIAMAWVPYDLWVNDVYSHCGVDVFTFLKTSEGWRISSLAFSMEDHNCK